IAADCGITGKCAVGDGECPAIIENRAAHAAAAAAVKQCFAAPKAVEAKVGCRAPATATAAEAAGRAEGVFSSTGPATAAGAAAARSETGEAETAATTLSAVAGKGGGVDDQSALIVYRAA